MDVTKFEELQLDDRISNTIMDMQIALDRYNQTVLFEVDI